MAAIGNSRFTQHMELVDELAVQRGSLEVLESGNLIFVQTQGDAVRQLCARTAFLDCLLRDESIISEIVADFDAITGASRIVERIHQHFNDGRDLSGEKPAADSRHSGPARYREGITLTKELYSIVEGKDQDQTRQLVAAAGAWAQSSGFDWPWLVYDLVMWYRDKVMHLNPTGGWFGRLSRPPGEWKLMPLDELEWPTLVLRHRKGENVDAYRERARMAFKAFLAKLDEEWPRGRVPTEAASIQRDVGWFYRHRAKRESKSLIAATDFAHMYDHAPPEERQRLVDGRRKDVRDGIRRAESLLSSSRVRFVEGSVDDAET
ncbi:MAG: hypothetical protein M3198_11755 [Actinomycetota bacterium]|nr:hypothetical protein [Actinomycetota bacterium]